MLTKILNWFRKPILTDDLGFLHVICEGGEEFKIRIAKLQLSDKALHCQSAPFVTACTITVVKILDLECNELQNVVLDVAVPVSKGYGIVLIVGLSDVCEA